MHGNEMAGRLFGSQPRARQDVDPTTVDVVGCARPSPSSVRPSEPVTVTADVHNPNDTAVSFEVTWGASEVGGQPSLVRQTGQVGAQSTATVQASFVPQEVPNLPAPPFETNVKATVVPGSIGGVFSPRGLMDEPGGCSLCGHAPIRALSADCGGLTVLTEGGEAPKGLDLNLEVLAVGGGAIYLARRRGII